MGGKRRKIPMEKIEKKESRSVCFSKRRKSLYGKASELCLLSDTQIAILATPPSSNSNVSFFSFGHSSVDEVVEAFLSDQLLVPVRSEKLGLGFWWENESLAKSENTEELRLAIDSILKILKHLKENQRNNQDDNDIKKKTTKDVALCENQGICKTLNLKSSSREMGLGIYYYRDCFDLV